MIFHYHLAFVRNRSQALSQNERYEQEKNIDAPKYMSIMYVLSTADVEGIQMGNCELGESLGPVRN